MSRTAASSLVLRAIAQGLLPDPTTLRCTDCPDQAAVYDHYKGYAPENWLEVQPVCVTHNVRRSYLQAAKQTRLLTSVLVRLPDDLIDRLDEEAKEHERSRNSQLIWILRERYQEAAVEETEAEYTG